jgi:hypothetical protein
MRVAKGLLQYRRHICGLPQLIVEFGDPVRARNSSILVMCVVVSFTSILLDISGHHWRTVALSQSEASP